ncbi:MAG: inorganic diphosphatase [Rhodocyclaceae bacterium]|nr:inorganic diphosphatase [Rhodocyclaceae bacterium]
MIASRGPTLEVVVEVPRGSFLKRGSNGHIDFVSPLPCPFNYGAVPRWIGLEGDLLDALVLGPRLPAGRCLAVPSWGAIVLTDRGLVDHKLVCCEHRPSDAQMRFVLRFFHFYAACKAMLNLCRGQRGRNACDGWCSAQFAIDSARPRDDRWRGPTVEF